MDVGVSGLVTCVLAKRGCQLAQRLGYRIIRDGVYQSKFEGSRRRDFFGGYEKLQRPSLPNQTRQALRASPSRHQAKGSAAMSEDRIRSGNSSMTGEREIEASTHAVAFYGGDDRGGITGDCIMSCCPMTENS